MTLYYHITDAKNVESIRTKGLQTRQCKTNPLGLNFESAHQGKERVIYLYTSLAALNSVRNQFKDPAVYQVELDDSEFRKGHEIGEDEDADESVYCTKDIPRRLLERLQAPKQAVVLPYSNMKLPYFWQPTPLMIYQPFYRPVETGAASDIPSMMTDGKAMDNATKGGAARAAGAGATAVAGATAGAPSFRKIKAFNLASAYAASAPNTQVTAMDTSNISAPPTPGKPRKK